MLAKIICRILHHDWSKWGPAIEESMEVKTCMRCGKMEYRHVASYGTASL